MRRSVFRAASILILCGVATSAAAPGGYDNYVPTASLAGPYAEVCWVNGARQVDVHPAGGSTAGGNCTPSDVGFVVDGTERGPLRWYEAMEDCLGDGMRLLEPFEFVVACEVAQGNGIATFGDTFEFASNRPENGRVTTMGTNACLGTSDTAINGTLTYHCAMSN